MNSAVFASLLRIILVFALAQPSFSQSPVWLDCAEETDTEHKYCSRAHLARNIWAINSTMNKTASTAHSATERGYDVLRYELFLDWTTPLNGTSEMAADRIYTGTQTITLRTTQALERVVLDAHKNNIRLDSAFLLAHIRQRIAFTQTDDNLAILQLPSRTNAQDSVRFVLHFSHIGTENSNDGLGFFLYNKGRFGAVRRSAALIDTVTVPERLAYTMSQPFGARRWMPCNDTPADKAFMRLRVRVPLGFRAVSNGLLRARTLDTTQRGQTSVITETFHYAHDYVIPPYLMAISASRYDSYTEYYKRVTKPQDSIPVEHFFWRVDDTNLDQRNFYYNARETFRHTVPTLEAYSRWFGEYPFESYGHVVVQPFFAGGMEHQTMSTINRSWLRGTIPGIAHEIMHQWFGDKVTCASWEHIWLNEGMASYGEALWYESWGRLRWYNVAFENFKRRYFWGNNKPSLYVRNPNSIDTIFNYATTYVKGAYVHHMLRRMVGDSVYFPAMRAFCDRYSVATTEDLQRIFEEFAPRSPVKIATFFKQWVYGAEHPILSASWRLLPTQQTNQNTTHQNTLHITLVQAQRGANIPEAFHLALPLVFKRGSDSIAQMVVMTERRQNFTLTLPFVPDSVLIDPDENILAEKYASVRLSDTGFANTKPLLRVVANPLFLGEAFEVLLTLPEAETIHLDVVDVLGRRLQTLASGRYDEGALHFREQLDFPAGGTYFVRLQTKYGLNVAKILVR
ncbi:MAG: hypothetical protein EAZ92_06850 [Candidatus Kapaibacterium sp.]|nr:MAG: hypothetical protein EAZ92_06850 [Candidatus Kapabacteria bacterium]